MKNTVFSELLHAVGKLAVALGEEWRLRNPELMDAYDACCQLLIEERNGGQVEQKAREQERERCYQIARGGEDRFEKYGTNQIYWKGRSDVAGEIRRLDGTKDSRT